MLAEMKSLVLMWRGLRDTEKLLAVPAIILTLAVTVLGPLASHYNFWLGSAVAFVGLIASSFAGSLLSERYLALLRGQGWRCRCGERIGLAGEGEAFRLSGWLGDLPNAFYGEIQCPRGHRTRVEWPVVWNELWAHLDASGSRAVGAATSNSGTDDVQKQAVAAGESDFVRRAHGLTRQGSLGAFQYRSADELTDVLKRFARRPWPSKRDQREELYALVAATESLVQLARVENEE